MIESAKKERERTSWIFIYSIISVGVIHQRTRTRTSVVSRNAPRAQRFEIESFPVRPPAS